MRAESARALLVQLKELRCDARVKGCALLLSEAKMLLWWINYQYLTTLNMDCPDLSARYLCLTLKCPLLLKQSQCESSFD